MDLFWCSYHIVFFFVFLFFSVVVPLYRLYVSCAVSFWRVLSCFGPVWFALCKRVRGKLALSKRIRGKLALNNRVRGKLETRFKQKGARETRFKRKGTKEMCFKHKGVRETRFKQKGTRLATSGPKGRKIVEMGLLRLLLATLREKLCTKVSLSQNARTGA